MPLVGVVMGSKSDAEALKPALEILEQLGVDYEVNVISAHRTPEKARQYGMTARERGIEVIIAAAGGPPTCPVFWPAGQLCRLSGYRSSPVN